MSSKSAPSAKAAEKSPKDEVEKLKAELRGMEILLQQNAALEKEVERLNVELDEATAGVQKKGYLYKWREREIYYAAKWGLRYFILQGNKISYYANDHDNRPRRTIDLSNCYVRDEGKKKGHHIFSVYLGSLTPSEGENPLDSSLLLRLSSESSAEASQWIDMIEQGCVVKDGSFPPLNGSASFVSEPTQTSDAAINIASKANKTKPYIDPCEEELSPTSATNEDWGHPHTVNSSDDLSTLAEDETPAASPAPPSIPSVMMRRVQSSTKVLQKSQSRQTFARRILSTRAPQDGPGSPGGGSAKRTKAKGIHKSFPAFKPMHVQAQTSPLSPDISKVDINFRGFFNLGVIILLISHLELIINNLMRYGFKASIPFIFVRLATFSAEFSLPAESLHYPLLAIATWCASVLVSFLIEKAAATWKINERVVLAVNFLFGTINIVGPCALVWFGNASPGANMVYLLQSVVVWMKLISYAHANRGLRRSSRKIKKADLANSAASSGAAGGTATPSAVSRQSSADDLYSDNNAKPYGDEMALLLAECKDLQPPFLLYPQNITAPNLLYFMVAPTLCYQLNYPRSDRIRWSKVLFIVLRMLFIAVILIFAVEQYITPTLETVLAPMEERDVVMVVERLLKLSIPNTYVWLLGFYFFFHLWLNLLAELTRFGDRLFYKEWWNARTIDEYW